MRIGIARTERVLAILLLSGLTGCASAILGATPPPPVSYFPLVVGTSWTYQCSIEGEHQSDKTITIAAEELAGDARIFRVTQTVRSAGSSNPEDADFFYRLVSDVVSAAPSKTMVDAQPIGATDLRAGMHLGALTVARQVEVVTPATGRQQGWLAQTFDNESPDIPEEKRLTWKGVTFVKGFGVVVEADGMGGECVLSAFHLGKRAE